jgi:hypothetical protein
MSGRRVPIVLVEGLRTILAVEILLDNLLRLRVRNADRNTLPDES